MIIGGALTAIKFIRDLIVAEDTSAGTRIYIDVAPQSATYPLVVMSIVSRSESPTQDDGSAVDEYRVQIDSYAEASAGTSAFNIASTLADAIRATISRQVATSDNLIDGIQEVNYLTDFIPEIEVSRVTNDYMIRIKDR